MIRKLIRRVLAGLRKIEQESDEVPAARFDGKVDFTRFESRVAGYRARGARIGEKVRLLKAYGAEIVITGRASDPARQLDRAPGGRRRRKRHSLPASG